MTSAADPNLPLDPAGLTGAEFSRVRKGYEPVEVRAILSRAAGALEAVGRQRDRLMARVTELEAEAANSIEHLDEARIAQALGQETVRVIEAARAAATEIRTKAEERAGRLVADAQEEAERLRSEAHDVLEAGRTDAEAERLAGRDEREGLLAEAQRERDGILEQANAVLGERTAEAEEAAAAIRAEAEAQLAAALEEAETARIAAAARATEILDEATARAADHLEEIRTRGRAMVEETKELRRRILEDIANRRRTARMQFEAARAGRERLLAGVETVRSLLEEVSGELSSALPEARAVADSAARDASDDLAASVDELAGGLREVELPELDGPAAPGHGPWSGLIGDDVDTPAPADTPTDLGVAAPIHESERTPTRSVPLILGEMPGGDFDEPTPDDPLLADEPEPVAVDEPVDEPEAVAEPIEEEETVIEVADSEVVESPDDVEVEAAEAAAVEAPATEAAAGSAEAGATEVEEIEVEEFEAEEVEPPYLLVPAEQPEGPARMPGADALVIHLADRRTRAERPGDEQSDMLAIEMVDQSADDDVADELEHEGLDADAGVDKESVAEEAATDEQIAEEAATGEQIDESAIDEQIDEPIAEEAATDEAAEGESSSQDGDTADRVGDLFARLRAGADSPSTGATALAITPLHITAAEPEPEPGSETEPAQPVAQPAASLTTTPLVEPMHVAPEAAAATLLDAEATEGGDDRILNDRDHLLAPLERSLARHLKRLVSDDQNEVLDRLRRARRGGSQPPAFPDVDLVVRRYTDALSAELRSVASAGAEHWRSQGGADRELDLDAVQDRLDERVRLDVVDALVTRVERAVEDGRRDGDDPSELVDRVRATCREWRTARVQEVAGDLATAAFNLGILAVAEAGATARWVVDHGGLPCADGDDNALAPPTPCGTPFPTGHECAPAHPGCRCILVPARQ